MDQIKLRFLDHVAIYTRDMEKSAQWYESVLGLKKYAPEKWQSFPIFMLAGKTGVAIFPARTDQPISRGTADWLEIDHFAFNVDRENFDKARKRYEALGMKHQFQDHYYFHSLYTRDPDGHVVELTTLMVPEEEFYGAPERKTIE